MKIKKILLLYKQSTYKHYCSKSGSLAFIMKKNNAIEKRFINTHLEHYRTLREVESFLKKSGIAYKKMLRGHSNDLSTFDFVITVGGDGTFLEGASQVTTQLMLGINSDPKWSVGRFCTANITNFQKIIDNILMAKAKIQTLNRMKISLAKSKKFILALNDILICHKNPATMSRYFMEFKKFRQEQRSSGIWVATAAGSTGAIRSAGGRVINEKSLNLQFVVREPYCGKTGKIDILKAVFKQNTNFNVTSLMTEGIIYVDGSHISLPFGFGEKMSVENSQYPIRMVTS